MIQYFGRNHGNNWMFCKMLELWRSIFTSSELICNCKTFVVFIMALKFLCYWCMISHKVLTSGSSVSVSECRWHRMCVCVKMCAHSHMCDVLEYSMWQCMVRAQYLGLWLLAVIAVCERSVSKDHYIAQAVLIQKSGNGNMREREIALMGMMKVTALVSHSQCSNIGNTRQGNLS